uniref:RNA-dependent RNA polymerase n=1 Tax=Globodera pallida TaxID=36090 RepID=A0A183CSQ1_GLOPA
NGFYTKKGWELQSAKKLPDSKTVNILLGEQKVAQQVRHTRRMNVGPLHLLSVVMKGFVKTVYLHGDEAVKRTMIE